MNISPKQSHYILQGLLAEGRIKQKNMVEMLGQLSPEIKALQKRLKFLSGLKAEVGRMPRVGQRHQDHKISANGREAMRNNARYAGAVRRATPKQRKEIEAMRHRQGISRAVARARKLGLLPAKSRAVKVKAVRVARSLSAAGRKSLRLSGLYMHSLKGLPAADRAKVKALRAKEGRESAIKLAKSLAGKA